MQILTANRLIDGDVVFLTSQDDWSIDINDSAIALTKSDVERLEDIGATADSAAHVIGCYLVDVTYVDDLIEATHYREIMRTKGPTVRSDLGKQARVYGSGGLRSGAPVRINNPAQNDNALLQEKLHVSL